MTNDAPDPLFASGPQGAGQILRAARERAGLSIDEIARKTRIAGRQIASIEAGRFDELPARVYAVGFARTIAQVVGLDQDEVAAMVRAELGEEIRSPGPAGGFAPGEPARMPGRRLVWFSLLALVLLALGLFVAARELFAPAAQLPPVEPPASPAPARVGAQGGPVRAGGPVVFTASGTVWLRLTDASGRILVERELAAGESYTLPAGANGARLMTGRPDLLAISLGGRNLKPLADEPVTMADVPVDAASLLAREAALPTAGGVPGAGGANGPAPAAPARDAGARPAPGRAAPQPPSAPLAAPMEQPAEAASPVGPMPEQAAPQADRQGD